MEEKKDAGEEMKWFRVGDREMLELGRITTVQAGHKSICLTRTEKGYGALCNSCIHQGGPLGDGMLENGYVVCPWHAWEFDPITGVGPVGYEDEQTDSFPVELREDGVYVGITELVHNDTLMDQVVRQMLDWGVNTVFGMVGHSNLGLADAYYKYAKDGRLNYIGVRHEGAAAFAASAYGKLTGKPAVAFSIAGPGATNLLTGLWDAKVDRAPVIAMTGQVNTQVLGPGAFQEVPLSKAFESVTNWSQTVIKRENATELMSLAIKHAIINRDVTHLIFPDEIQTVEAFENSVFSKKEGRISRDTISPPAEDLQKAIKMINESKNPCIIIGNGARPYAEDIIKFAEKISAPMITTFKAKGTVPDSHPLACGVLGRSGTRVSSAVMVKSDLLIVLGASFSNHTSISVKKKIIQIDYDRLMLGKFHYVDLPVWGEIQTTLNLLIVEEKTNNERREYVKNLWKDWREEKYNRSKTEDKTGRIVNVKIFSVLSDLIPEDAVITVDVGNNAYSFGMYFESKKQDVLMSGYLGSIGFAFPAAMGAWAAVGKERKIVAIAGDGGFGQYMAEFTTAVKHKMPITLILLNNDELGKISREQKNGNFHLWQTSLVNPNFADYANSCGGLGIRVEREEDLIDSIKKALDHDGPAIVEIISSAGQL